MVQLVNGFSCYNSADAALAKRGIDPGAAKARATPAATAIASTQGAAVMGSLSTGLQPSARSEPPQLGAPAAGRGQLVDLLA